MSNEYKLSYTAPDINERLGKVDEIDVLKDLVGTTSVANQISNALDNMDVKIDVDTTLSTSGAAADAKATGDAITNLNTLVGNIPIDNKIADAIADAIVDVYVQDEEPEDAQNGSIWVDTDEDGMPSTSGNTSSNVYVVDARTTDMTTIDFSQYAIGSVVVVTMS